jgi:membrane protein DedA with SNARE-associated domain
MEHQFYEIIAEYGIFAVFALCTVEGDITLLISGVMAHSEFFGPWSWIKVLFFGTLGGVVGDSFAYLIGRMAHENAKHYRFYQVAQPRIEKLIDKFGSFAIIISKYIYGIRVAMCLSYGVAQTPFPRFLAMSALSCGIWVTLLSGVGYFFSGAITSMIGDYKRIGFGLFMIVMLGVIIFYVIERYWLSEKVEAADPETIQMIEEKFHVVEEAAQEKLHVLADKIHFTREPAKDDPEDGPPTATQPTIETTTKHHS